MANKYYYTDFQKYYQNLSVGMHRVLYNKEIECSQKYVHVAGSGRPLTPDLLHPITVVNLIN